MLMDGDRKEFEFLHRLRDGDQVAFTYFYEEYQLRIYRRLLKMVKIGAVAEELTQEVFIKIWEKRELIDPEQSFSSYLFRIAQNLLYDFYRKLARDEKLQNEIRLTLPLIRVDTDEKIYLKETQEIFQKALASLSVQQRQVYELCKLQGKSYDEASQILGISPNTISTHMTRASKSIRNYFSKHQFLVFMSLVISGL